MQVIQASAATVENLLGLVSLIKTKGIESHLQEMAELAKQIENSQAEANESFKDALAKHKEAEELRLEAHATMADATAKMDEANRMGESARVAHKNAKAMEKEADDLLNRARAHVTQTEQELKVRESALVEREKRVADAIAEAERAKSEYEQKLSALRASVN